MRTHILISQRCFVLVSCPLLNFEMLRDDRTWIPASVGPVAHNNLHRQFDVDIQISSKPTQTQQRRLIIFKPSEVVELSRFVAHGISVAFGNVPTARTLNPSHGDLQVSSSKGRNGRKRRKGG